MSDETLDAVIQQLIAEASEENLHAFGAETIVRLAQGITQPGLVTKWDLDEQGRLALRISGSAARSCLCWDNLNTHVSVAMPQLIAVRDWLHVIRLPRLRTGPQPHRSGLIAPEEHPVPTRPHQRPCSAGRRPMRLSGEEH